MRHSRRAFLGAAATAALAGCLGDSGDSLDPDVEDVSLLLNWVPNGLHVPYYVADERGYYEDQGLELSSIEAGDGSDFAAQQVGLENQDLAITSADQILNVNSRELSPTCVGVMMQRGPVVLFTRRSQFGEEFTSPDQLEGLTVGSGPGMVRQMTQSYLETHGVFESVNYVDSGFDTVQQLLSGQIDAAGGVFGDVVDARLQSDATIDTVNVADDIPHYGHVIATNDSFMEDHSDAIRAFIRGTAEGAAWAYDNPDDATDILIEAESELEGTWESQRGSWGELSQNYMISDAVESEGWGWNEADPWQETHDVLESGGFLGGSVDPESVWTNEYIDTDYEYVGDFVDQIDR